MEFHIIDTAKFHADGGAMFGAVPKSAWGRKYPADDNNQCILVTRSVLIKTDCGKIVLIDSGAGSKHQKTLAWYRFFDQKDLIEEIRKLGVEPHQITDVVLTHLHFDHCGYCATESGMAFPNATHWVGKEQWEEFLHPNPLEKDSFFIDDMEAVEKNGKLRLISEDISLCDAVSLKIFGGHTKGQIAVYFGKGDNSFVFAGDVIPLAASISPTWISAYDCFPVESYMEKVKLLDEAAASKRKVIFCHDAYTPYCLVKKVNDFYAKL